MPVYEYECPKHGRFEQVRSISEHSPIAECEVCHKICNQVFDSINVVGISEGRHESKMWRDAPTKFYMGFDNKRKRK